MDITQEEIEKFQSEMDKKILKAEARKKKIEFDLLRLNERRNSPLKELRVRKRSKRYYQKKTGNQPQVKEEKKKGFLESFFEDEGEN